MRLQDIITKDYSYHISKLYDGIEYREKIGISGANIRTLISMTDTVKKEVNAKHGDVSSFIGLELVLKDTDYAGTRIND